jgi:hypothetical protein
MNRLAIQLFQEMLITSQFSAVVPSQQSDDVGLSAGIGQSRGGEMAEIVDVKSIDASKLCYTTESLSEVPCMRSLELAFEPWVGLGRKDVFVIAVAWESTEGGDGHVKQVNSLGFVVLRLPDVQVNLPLGNRFCASQ